MHKFSKWLAKGFVGRGSQKHGGDLALLNEAAKGRQARARPYHDDRDLRVDRQSKIGLPHKNGDLGAHLARLQIGGGNPEHWTARRGGVTNNSGGDMDGGRVRLGRRRDRVVSLRARVRITIVLQGLRLWLRS